MEPKDIQMALSPYIFNPDVRWSRHFDGYYKESSVYEPSFIAKELQNRHDTIKPHLYHLSDLKDEHAIEVAKCFRDDIDWCLVAKEGDYITISNRFSSMQYQLRIRIKGDITISFLIGESDVEIPAYAIIKMQQKLQELNYGVPYMGNCLFENGISIRKEVGND